MENITIAVQQINQESEGVISLLLTGVDSNELPAWTPGAHIGLKLDGGIERQYSLCGKTADRSHWQVAVLREPESRGGSAWIHSQLRVGDQLKATPPSNQFPLVEAPFYLFIGGGIGITPLIPMIEGVWCMAAASWIPWPSSNSSLPTATRWNSVLKTNSVCSISRRWYPACHPVA